MYYRIVLDVGKQILFIRPASLWQTLSPSNWVLLVCIVYQMNPGASDILHEYEFVRMSSQFILQSIEFTFFISRLEYLMDSPSYVAIQRLF